MIQRYHLHDYESDDSVDYNDYSVESPHEKLGIHPVIPKSAVGGNDAVNDDEYESDSSEECATSHDTKPPHATQKVVADHNDHFFADEYETDESTRSNKSVTKMNCDIELWQHGKLPQSSSITLKNRCKPPVDWEERFLELVRFKENHGHCNVSQKSEKGLGIWVNSQRYKLYKRWLQKGDACQETVERVQRLNELGFQWKVQDRAPPQVSWEKRFSELVSFQKIHGHCNVPQKAEKGLGIWVNSQRSKLFKRCLEKGDACQKTAERVRRLNELGFQWKVQNRKTIPIRWEKRFFELVSFQKIHGHCNVPQRSHDGLGNWVNKQRSNLFKRWSTKGGRTCQVTVERVRRLNELGFQWKASK